MDREDYSKKMKDTYRRGCYSEYCVNMAWIRVLGLWLCLEEAIDRVMIDKRIYVDTILQKEEETTNWRQIEDNFYLTLGWEDGSQGGLKSSTC